MPNRSHRDLIAVAAPTHEWKTALSAVSPTDGNRGHPSRMSIGASAIRQTMARLHAVMGSQWRRTDRIAGRSASWHGVQSSSLLPHARTATDPHQCFSVVRRRNFIAKTAMPFHREFSALGTDIVSTTRATMRAFSTSSHRRVRCEPDFRLPFATGTDPLVRVPASDCGAQRPTSLGIERAQRRRIFVDRLGVRPGGCVRLPILPGRHGRAECGSRAKGASSRR
jgi:hypothetical protein